MDGIGADGFRIALLSGEVETISDLDHMAGHAV